MAKAAASEARAEAAASGARADVSASISIRALVAAAAAAAEAAAAAAEAAAHESETETEDNGDYGGYVDVCVGGGTEKIKVKRMTKIWCGYRGEQWYQHAGMNGSNVWHHRKSAARNPYSPMIIDVEQLLVQSVRQQC